MAPRTPVNTDAVPAPGGAFSLGIHTNHLVFTAGQVGADPSGKLRPTFAQQVEQAIDNLELVLQAANSTLAHVVKSTCFLADPADFAEFNEIYARRFSAPLPARSTVGVRFAGAGDLLFEIEAVAVTREVDE
ncbi:2-iminobutanoate/2-iminopropanoate deaminase [Rhodococcus wratislaviensis]|uniref:Endoribonuclease L-PSP n=1 Tax=Rhodococcus wratislaviensis TaxID=44752 RepID=A0AB38FDC5_RHOWR|nr:Rid family hydrolase [Rhodococcus wratislaviensis]REE75455.1 2-iminobutanoate/2-iminopropanoate deaminase [Rhodococcus wratislaviensis]SPZ39511.1 endoribonuclease L-PSP [Rhodococcus wratislaviensis]